VRVHVRESPPLAPVSGSASLGDLAPGESASARLRVEVSSRALDGQYPLSLVVERDDSFGDPVTTEPLSTGVTVGPERTVETGSAGSVPAGSTTTVAFEVTNTGAAPMRDAVVRLNADSPFETDDDTAYVGTLGPGESATVRFTVSVGGAATPKSYALDTTVAFDNSFDRRVVTDVASTELRVETGGGGPLAALLDLLGL
jgi:S-layer domain